MESAEMTLPPSLLANSTEANVFPVAVGPAMMTRGLFFSFELVSAGIAVHLGYSEYVSDAVYIDSAEMNFYSDFYEMEGYTMRLNLRSISY